MGYKIQWRDNNGIYIKYDGDISLNDMIAVNRLISHDSRYALLKYNISDFLKVTNLNLSKKDIEALSIFHVIPSIWNPNLKLSVVSDNSHIREMVLRYINLMKANEWEIKLFDNLEEAIKWEIQE